MDIAVSRIVPVFVIGTMLTPAFTCNSSVRLVLDRAFRSKDGWNTSNVHAAIASSSQHGIERMSHSSSSSS